jgi:hypothetical protein
MTSEISSDNNKKKNLYFQSWALYEAYTITSGDYSMTQAIVLMIMIVMAARGYNLHTYTYDIG